MSSKIILSENWFLEKPTHDGIYYLIDKRNDHRLWPMPNLVTTSRNPKKLLDQILNEHKSLKKTTDIVSEVNKN